MQPNRKRKQSLNDTVSEHRSQTKIKSSSAFHNTDYIQDPYEIKLGITSQSDQLDIKNAKSLVHSLKLRQNPTPNAGIGVNYAFLRSNKIPVPQLKYGKQDKNSKKENNFTSEKNNNRTSSSLSFSSTVSSLINSGTHRLDNNSFLSEDDNQFILHKNRPFTQDEDAINKISKRIHSASVSVREGLVSSLSQRKSISPSKQSTSSSIARVIPHKTKEYLLNERRDIKSQLEEGYTDGSTVNTEDLVHRSFQKLIRDIEDDMKEAKISTKSKKHGFKRHFKNTTFDSLDTNKQDIDKQIYEAARQQEARDRQEKELLILLKAKIRRQKQRASFKTQQQHNFLKRLASQEPRLMEQLADILDPTLDEFQQDIQSFNGYTSKNITQSDFSRSDTFSIHSQPTLTPTPLYTNKNSIYRNINLQNGMKLERPHSTSSTFSRPQKHRADLERAVADFDDDDFFSNQSNLNEIDKFERKFKY